MGLVGCYSLHIYCDDPNHKSTRPGKSDAAEFTAHTEGRCLKEARKGGWLIDKFKPGREGSGHAICPKCRRKEPR